MPPPPTRVVRPKKSAGHRRSGTQESLRRASENDTAAGLTVLSVGMGGTSPKRLSARTSATNATSTAGSASASGARGGDSPVRRPGGTRAGASTGTEPASRGISAVTVAPVDLMSEFLGAVMSKQYIVAQALCERILTMEPQNETVRQFLPVIKEKIAQDCEISDDDDDEDRTENAGSDDVDSDDSSAEEENGDEDDVDMISDDNGAQQQSATYTPAVQHRQSHDVHDVHEVHNIDGSGSDDDDDNNGVLDMEQPARHEGSGVLMRSILPGDIERLRQSIMKT